MKRFRTGILVILVVLLGSIKVEQAPHPTVSNPSAARTQSKSIFASPAAAMPGWTVGYDREFWRKSSSKQDPISGTAAVNVRDVIDRVSHAFRGADYAAPAVIARDYKASVEG